MLPIFLLDLPTFFFGRGFYNVFDQCQSANPPYFELWTNNHCFKSCGVGGSWMVSIDTTANSAAMMEYSDDNCQKWVSATPFDDTCKTNTCEAQGLTYLPTLAPTSKPKPPTQRPSLHEEDHTHNPTVKYVNLVSCAALPLS